jgi:hypothetical protein
VMVGQDRTEWLQAFILAIAGSTHPLAG